MKWKVLGTLVAFSAGIAALHGCSSDDESGSSGKGSGGSALGGGAGLGGNTATGGADQNGSGGAASGGLGGGGLGGFEVLGGAGGGGGDIELSMICEQNLGAGGAKAECGFFPKACGDRSDYKYAVFGTADAEEIYEPGAPAVVFGLAGGDELDGINVGSCLVGGEGNDTISFKSDSSEPRSNTGVGGPGNDAWFITRPLSAPAILADVEANELIYLANEYKVSDGIQTDEGVEIIENFGGTNAEMHQATTRIVYDPKSGKIWQDDDGNAETASPIVIGIVANAAHVTLTPSNFSG